MVEPALQALQSTALEGIPHGFMTRMGGVSSGAVAGLQCGYGAGDDQADVAENRRRASESILPGGTLVTPYQVHSPDVATVTQPWALAERPHVDALVTDRPSLVLGIVTADCAPVLLADQQAGVAGAAHAGWRGAHGGVLEATIAAMESLGANKSRIHAAIGPTIAQDSYEVDDRFRANFTEDEAAYFKASRAGHYQFDLPAYVARRLSSALTDSGIARIDDLKLDTYADAQRFYSYRRATHTGEANYGRQLSLIAVA